MEPDKKFEEVSGKLKQLLDENNYELLAQAFITPDGRILARPVLGPKEEKAVPSPIVLS